MTAAVLQAVVFLAATSLLVPAFRKAGLSIVMAFLVIGVLIGPNGLGRLADLVPWTAALALDPEGPAHWLAELGIVFLLFAIGLEVSAERLWALRRLILGLGAAQVCITAATITLIALAFGNAFEVAAVVGLAFALSSTAVVLQLLGERRQLAGPAGRAAFSVLLFQDLAVIPILFTVSALAAPAAGAGVTFLIALAGALVAVPVILIAGRFVLRPLFRWAASIGSREVFVAAALLVVVGSALAAEAAGLSMALGAFLAGLLLAETEFRHEIETDVEPFKGLLLGLFFVTVGMQIDLDLAWAEPARLAIGVMGLFVVKAAILIPLARAFGLKWPQAIEVALLLAQTGEFAFVIVSLATDVGLFPPGVAEYMLLVIAASIFLTPAVAALGTFIARRLMVGSNVALATNEVEGVSGHVVIAGYGRVGQTLGDILQKQEVPHVALDMDVAAVEELRKRGWPVHFGDATHKDILTAVGIERAAAIVVTMNTPEAVERVVSAARGAWPHVPVFARARDSAQARKLHAAGAEFASPETVEATLQLGEALLNGLGFQDEVARRIIGERREVERAKSLSS